MKENILSVEVFKYSIDLSVRSHPCQNFMQSLTDSQGHTYSDTNKRRFHLLRFNTRKLMPITDDCNAF
jgi:hypothetical protein